MPALRHTFHCTLVHTQRMFTAIDRPHLLYFPRVIGMHVPTAHTPLLTDGMPRTSDSHTHAGTCTRSPMFTYTALAHSYFGGYSLVGRYTQKHTLLHNSHIRELSGAHRGAQLDSAYLRFILPSAVHTFKRALQVLTPAVQVAAGTEEAADGGGNHSHEEDHGGGDACYGLGT